VTNRGGLLGVFAFCVTLAACGGSAVPGGSGTGKLRATIDGVGWVADDNTIQVTGSAATPSALTITGSQVASAASYVSMVLALGYVDGPKMYPLGVNQGTNAGGSATIIDLMNATAGNWMTDLSGARGFLTITGMTSERFTGIFWFTAPAALGSTVTSTRSVIDGSFDLLVPAEFRTPSADDYGSSMVATVNGQPWNGATIVGVGDTATGALSFGGTTTGVNLSFATLMPVSAGGTFDQTALPLTAFDNGASWGGAGSVSSVTVTTLSAKRIIGTFTATLQPTNGAASPMTITAGAFDVRIDPA
jgi:hypothetical protein